MVELDMKPEERYKIKYKGSWFCMVDDQGNKKKKN